LAAGKSLDQALADVSALATTIKAAIVQAANGSRGITPTVRQAV
jgi:hypothetical protein